MKIVYGPVASWRLGRSLGIDVICSKNKICSFDCTYCQLQHTERITTKQEAFINVDEMRQELAHALESTTADVVTLSGMGEPTLASNLSEIIQGIRQTTKLPIALLTNSTLLYKPETQQILKDIDIIVAKLDAPNQQLFQRINRPAKGVTFSQTLKGIKEMKNQFSGRFDLQMMFIDENKDEATAMAELARLIDPDVIELNTPLRPCKIAPLSQQDMDVIQTYFSNMSTISVYHSEKPKTDPIDKLELIQRRRMEE